MPLPDKATAPISQIQNSHSAVRRAYGFKGLCRQTSDPMTCPWRRKKKIMMEDFTCTNIINVVLLCLRIYIHTEPTLMSSPFEHAVFALAYTVAQRCALKNPLCNSNFKVQGFVKPIP